MCTHLESFFKNSLTVHGLSGDRTLEFIGLVIKGVSVIEARIYNTLDDTAHFSEDWHESLWNKYFGRMSERLPIKICDTSVSETEDEPLYRMNVIIRSNASINTIKELSDRYLLFAGAKERERFTKSCSLVKNHIGFNAAVLMQLGVEADKELNYKKLKYYLSLRKDIYKRPGYSGKMSDLLHSFCQLYQKTPNKAEKMLMDIQDCGYYPSFIGVNDCGADSEIKLYFVSGLFGSSLKKDALVQAQKLCKVLALNGETGELTAQAPLRLNIYPMGIAVSFEEDPLIRLYFKEIPEKLK